MVASGLGRLEHLNYDISHWVGAAAYLLLTFFAGFCLSRSIGVHKKRLWSTTSVFFIFIALGSILRVAYFTCAPFVYEGWAFPQTIMVVLNTLPSYLFFTSYTTIIAVWARAYHHNVPLWSRLPSTMTTAKILNAVMYIVLLTLYIIMFVQSGFDNVIQLSVGITPVQNGIFAMTSAIDVLTCVVFFIYALLIVHFSFRHSVHHTRAGRTVLVKVLCISILYTVVFLVRSVITFIWAYALSKRQIKACWWIDLFYFFFLEVVPIIIMIVILGLDRGEGEGGANSGGALTGNSAASNDDPQYQSPAIPPRASTNSAAKSYVFYDALRRPPVYYPQNPPVLVTGD